MSKILPELLLLSLFAMTGTAHPQVGPLGPKDGFDLAPTDLERIKVDGAAPDFTLESKDGQAVTLSSYQGKKNVVLVFYRGHW